MDREKLLDQIEIDPKVMSGKPVIKGTRIPMKLILRKLNEEATEEKLRHSSGAGRRQSFYSSDALSCR